MHKKTLTNVSNQFKYVPSLYKYEMKSTMTDSIVIIPTYNEKENIENIIRVVFALDKKFDILI